MNEIARKPTLAHFLYVQEVENKIIEFTNSFINSKLVDYRTLLEDENINWLFFYLLVINFTDKEKKNYEKLDDNIFYKYKSRQLYFLYPTSFLGKLDIYSKIHSDLHNIRTLNKLVKEKLLIPIRRPNFMRTSVRYTNSRIIYYNDKLISKNKIDLKYYRNRFSKQISKLREEAIEQYTEGKRIINYVDYDYGYFYGYRQEERYIINKCGQPISLDLSIFKYREVSVFNQIRVNREKNQLEIYFPHCNEDKLKVIVDIKTNQVTGFDLVYRKYDRYNYNYDE